ncbi:MAG: hypothetical protein WCP22_07445 [Chlamydiota bacterium]
MNNASLDKLLSRVAPGGTAVRTLKASFSASFAGPGKGRARSVSGMLAMESPGMLRMKGSAAMLPTLFDLLWKDGQAALYIPRDRAVYRSTVGAVSAQRGLADAAFLTGVFLGSGERDGALHFLETEPSRYLVSSVRTTGGRASLARRIVFDRADLSPVRYEYFDAAGRLSREVRCAGFAAAEGASALLPRTVVIEAPEEGARIELRLSDLRVNAPLAAGMFTLETPPGTAVRPIEERAP